MNSFNRYWRLLSLFSIASILIFILIFLSKNDPNLELYFPYFRDGSKYYSSADIQQLEALMEPNILDYGFIQTNSRFCLTNNELNVKEDYRLFFQNNENEENIEEANRKLNSSNEFDHKNLDFLFISISKVDNLKFRSAARQTWSKKLSQLRSKLLFVVGNRLYSKDNTFSVDLKLRQEQNDYKDLIQINMPDDDNYTSTKTLIAMRWALSYCRNVKALLVLSDSAVLNYVKFEKIIKNATLVNKFREPIIAGSCDLENKKFSIALKSFFDKAYKKSSKKNIVKRSMTDYANNGSISEISKQARSIKTEYNGKYCSNLGWMIGIKAAQDLWEIGLRSPYMMRMSPAYLNGYLAYKGGFNFYNLFDMYDQIPQDKNCLQLFAEKPDNLLCAENFDVSNRYSNYIAFWNSGQSFLPKQ
jgi:hypothetical protein